MSEDFEIGRLVKNRAVYSNAIDAYIENLPMDLIWEPISDSVEESIRRSVRIYIYHGHSWPSFF